MKNKFRLGLLPARHLRELRQLFCHARRAFTSRPPVVLLFDSLAEVIELEQQRRELNLESDFYTIPWKFKLERLSPVSLLLLTEFFKKKRDDFQGEEPPVASFFAQLVFHFNKYCHENISFEARRLIKFARRDYNRACG